MEEAALKIDLHEKIDHASSEQLKQLYGLVINYFNSQYDEVEQWNSLSEIHKESIEQGLKEADAGLGTSFDEVTKSLKEKYGLNS